MPTATFTTPHPQLRVSLPRSPSGARTPLRHTVFAGALPAFVKLATALPFLGQYGWDRDELYYLQASRHLSLGYVDFPPRDCGDRPSDDRHRRSITCGVAPDLLA
jgi:hypothetical protein